MAIETVQSPTSSKQARTKKVLQHIEIHPRMGGGHLVKHIYEPRYDGKGEPTDRAVSFNEQGKSQGGEHIYDHLAKHAGLPEREMSKATEENEPEELANTNQEAEA